MKIIKVNLGERSYKIIVGYGILPLAGKNISNLRPGTAAYVITNARIKNRYAHALRGSLEKSGFLVKFKLIPDSEKAKSLETAYSVIKDITSFERRRRIFAIAFGGGVVGDLTGFVASLYKRGIPYIQIPTTLLAQVDSGIGGKTAVDLASGKNLVGAFYQPKLVFSDTKVLASLDSRQIKSGLAEVIKYGIIRDPRLFMYLEKKYRGVLALNADILEFIVARCSAIKAGIIEQDERETKGIRTVLNFGHTLGHAIEAASGYSSYNHGEAITLGMLLACDISANMGLVDAALCKRIEGLIKKIGLPTRISRVSLNAIIKAHYRDKKFTGAKNRFVLLSDIGKTKIIENVPLGIIKEVLKARSSGLSA
jgi:3-dehydroquinate synthase